MRLEHPHVIFFQWTVVPIVYEDRMMYKAGMFRRQKGAEVFAMGLVAQDLHV